MSNNRQRFQDALWYNKDAHFVVCGAGGIGSWFSFFTTRAGFATSIYDYDLVEAHNLGGQLFLVEDVGEKKIDAVANSIALFNDYNYHLHLNDVKIRENFYISHRYNDNIIFVVSAFDNMEARTNLFNAAIRKKADFTQRNSDTKVYFIDGRLLMEQMRIYCINMNDESLVRDYAVNHLFSDDEVEELPCSMKQVSHSAAMIASHMFGFCTNIISNELSWGENIFRVPYIWDYIIPLNKIEEKYEAS